MTITRGYQHGHPTCTINVGCETWRGTATPSSTARTPRGDVVASCGVRGGRPPSLTIIADDGQRVRIVLDDAETARELARLLDQLAAYQERYALDGRDAVVPSDSRIFSP